MELPPDQAGMTRKGSVVWSVAFHQQQNVKAFHVCIAVVEIET
jgi:hypothetical protein